MTEPAVKDCAQIGRPHVRVAAVLGVFDGSGKEFLRVPPLTPRFRGKENSGWRLVKVNAIGTGTVTIRDGVLMPLNSAFNRRGIRASSFWSVFRMTTLSFTSGIAANSSLGDIQER